LQVFPVSFNRTEQCLVETRDKNSKREREALQLLQLSVVSEFLSAFEHAPTAIRLSDLSKYEEFRLIVAGAVASVVQAEQGEADLVSATINLRDAEPRTKVLQNMRDRVLAKTGIRIRWVGVFIPEVGDKVPIGRHLHVILLNVKVHGPAWAAINRFMDGRNRKFPRSCHMKWVYELDGFAKYMESEKNLRRRGAKVVKSPEVLPYARQLCHNGLAPLRELVRNRLEAIRSRR